MFFYYHSSADFGLDIWLLVDGAEYSAAILGSMQVRSCGVRIVGEFVFSNCDVVSFTNWGRSFWIWHRG